MNRAIVVLCLLSAAGLFALAAPVAAQEERNPAVRLDRLEEALKKAKTLRVRFSSVVEAGNEKALIKGELLVASGGRVRIDLQRDLGGNTERLRIICDGQRQVVDREGPEKIERDWAEFIRALLRTSGLAHTTEPGLMSPDPVKALKPLALTFVDIERKGAAAVFVCRYRLPNSAREVGMIDVVLRLDNATNLPQSRELRAVILGGQAIVAREAYQIEIDPKLDDDLFKLKKGG